jgi:hypothetical protein
MKNIITFSTGNAEVDAKNWLQRSGIFMKPKSPSRQKQGHLLYPDLLEQLD